jgi:hypothetical protein
MKPMLFLFTLLSSLLTAQTVDTLFYGNSKKVPRNPYGSGYIAGTNAYGDIGKYQRFDLLEEVHVVGAKIWMGLKRTVDTADSITVMFRRTAYGKNNYDTLSGGPGALITSIHTTLDAFDTSSAGSSFFIPTPFNVMGGPFSPESIFVGIEWSATANDTFSLYVDSAGQGENADRAWELLTGVAYKYQRFNEVSDFSWALDADLWIALLYKKGLLGVQQQAGVPDHFVLEQNYPNPFNPSTTIGFSVPASGYVSLAVYDILGKHIATLVDQHLDGGRYTVNFSAPSLPSGMYFYRLRTASTAEIKRMMLLK